jgi:hypothetical protein
MAPRIVFLADDFLCRPVCPQGTSLGKRRFRFSGQVGHKRDLVEYLQRDRHRCPVFL